MVFLRGFIAPTLCINRFAEKCNENVMKREGVCSW